MGDRWEHFRDDSMALARDLAMWATNLAEGIGSFTAFVVMLGLFMSGLYHTLLGTIELLTDHESTMYFQHGIHLVLNGIELVFLAPITFLSWRAMSIFAAAEWSLLHSIKSKEPENQHAERDMTTPNWMQDARSAISEIKLALAGLLVALLLTDMIARVLTAQAWSPIGLAAHALGIVLCLFYYFALGNHSG